MRWISDTRRRVLLLGLSSAMNTLRIATTVTTVVTPFVLLAKHSGAFNGPRLALLLPPIAQRTARTAKKAGANKVFGRDLGTGAAMAAAARESRARNLCGRPQRRISTIPLQMSANFDFETPIDRWGTGSLKWEKYAGKDVIPLWVADMDLRVSPAIEAALHKHVEHGIFGYTDPTKGVKKAVMKYYKASSERHGVEIAAERWLLFNPGTVQGMNAACAMLPERASVMVMTPSYPPFFQTPGWTGRGLVTVPADRAGGRWTLDWRGMESAMDDHPETALFMLCNPYNPVGRVFTEEELRRLGEFCERHDLIIVSDEIHCDLILDEEVQHVSMLALDDGRFASRTVVLNSPSKTYNVPGLGCSYAIIPDAKLRKRFTNASSGWITQNSPLGYASCEAAYTSGEPWRQALLTHLRGNRAALYAFLEERLPELRIDPMEATYLAWVDVRELGWKNPAAEFERAGVGLTDGRTFLGDGFVRINFACPRATLMEALRRMERAVIEGYRGKDQPSSAVE
ncbi:unnamed protein product [Ascophyllum nodosum]